ncbi:MAG: formate/nitrite transporter family protein [Pseudomonadota bacterium]
MSTTSDPLTEVRDAADRDHEDTEEVNGIVSDKTRLHAAVVFEIIEREGVGELARGLPALFWSGVAAGNAIGISVVAEAMLTAYLPQTNWTPLVDNLGYSVGFLIVILGRQQLFTENTLTAVLPVMQRRKWPWFVALMRLWAVVLAANLVGCALFAAFIAYSGVLQPEVQAAVTKIGLHMMENDVQQMFIRGIAAGWLIAALVWMLPSAEGNEFIVITLMTYLIALGDFTHVIAGSAEALYLVFIGEIGLGAATFSFFLPTLAGNIFGGTVLFGVLSYAQVRQEVRGYHLGGGLRGNGR